MSEIMTKKQSETVKFRAEYVNSVERYINSKRMGQHRK